MEKQLKTPRGVIPVTYGPIRVVDVREHTFREDVAQAELRQTVIRHYPSARPSNSLIDDLFELQEFGFESADFENERVCWINIPLGATKQQVEEKLAKFPEAVIYRILADNVEEVLSAEQLFAIKSDQYDYTMDQATKAHIIMLVGDDGVARPVAASGEVLTGSVELDENGRIAQILEPDANFQYASKGFSLQYKEDVDLREVVAPPQMETAQATAEPDEAKTPAGAL